MVSTILEKNLGGQFGITSCLTGSQLDFENPETFILSETEPQCPLEDNIFSGLFDPEILMHGAGYYSVGKYEREYDLLCPDYEGAFLFGVIIKEPNSPEFCLPAQLSHLRTVIEIIALPMINTSQIASDWHTHKILSRKTITEERIEALEIPQRSVQCLDQMAADMVSCEYIVSNCVGSLIPAQRSIEKLSIKETPNGYSLPHPLDDSLVSILGNGEIARLSNYVFHRAATVAKDMIGQKRALLTISFTPSLLTKDARSCSL